MHTQTDMTRTPHSMCVHTYHTPHNMYNTTSDIQLHGNHVLKFYQPLSVCDGHKTHDWLFLSYHVYLTIPYMAMQQLQWHEYTSIRSSA